MLRNPVGIECLEDFALVLSTLLQASDPPPRGVRATVHACELAAFGGLHSS